MSGTVGDLILEVAQLLSDAEAGFKMQQWTKPELIEYANDAALQFVMLRPDLASTSRKVKLGPGARQQLPDGATHFYRVDGTLDSFGRVIGQPTQTDAAAARIAANWFAPLACGPRAGAYVVRSFSIDPVEQTAFYVDPPVPAGENVVVMVNFTAVPAHAGATDPLPMPERFHNAAIEWMLYRAYSKEQDSQSSTANATAHQNSFYSLIGLSQKVDDKYDKEVRASNG
ncbi:hypothetical protein OKW38_002225 [Paraburkholderia sp. MM5496-R1]|uniref:phage adaptor protein n=1 Tax=Paraburkholderia sp. MM5496-R1 TaxID=2991065 RepID=UPI003D1C49FD